MIWYPWNPKDYARDTRHLTLAEHGAYRLLIDCYMQEREPLPDSDRALARIVGIGIDEWLTVAENVRAFFKAGEGVLTHKRCEQELRAQNMRAKKRSEIAQKAAFGRWSKNNGFHAKSNGQAMHRDATLNKEVSPTSSESVTRPKGATDKKGFSVSDELVENLKRKGVVP